MLLNSEMAAALCAAMLVAMLVLGIVFDWDVQAMNEYYSLHMFNK